MIRSILVLLVLALPASANDLFLSQLQLDQLGTVADWAFRSKIMV